MGVLPSHCDEQVEYLHDGMVCLHQVVLHSSQALQHSLAKHSTNELAASREEYLNAYGMVLKVNLFMRPKRPGSLGLTQMRRQTQAPMMK